ncbi:MAG: hypothetical protein IJ283_07935 [Oscillospiraceae bacterium]|nr:hypothetical protein [Oscillospiraceae bacterium]
MITWLIMFLQKIEGANLFIAVIGAMWVLYAGFFLAIKANRGKNQLKAAAISGLVVTFISDMVWFFKFFDNFEYRNPGVGGVLWILLLPVLMFLCVMVLSYINASRYEFDKKKREKEASKQKKKEKRRKKYEQQSSDEEL